MESLIVPLGHLSQPGSSSDPICIRSRPRLRPRPLPLVSNAERPLYKVCIRPLYVLYLPARHHSHFCVKALPEYSAYLPIRHTVHVFEPVTVSVTEPSGQVRQGRVELRPYFPASQRVHFVLPGEENLSTVEPVAQTRHAIRDDCVYKPGVQGVHFVAADALRVSVIEPGLHVAQPWPF